MQDNSNKLILSRRSTWKHCILQAATGSVQSLQEVETHIKCLRSDSKTSNASSCIIAYRINDENFYQEDDEVGAGEKMASMIERMGIDNILAAILIWSDGRLLGPSAYRIILEKVKDLLLSIHSQVRQTTEEPKENMTLPHIDMDSLESTRLQDLNLSVSLRKPESLHYKTMFSNSRNENGDLLEELEIKSNGILNRISPTELWNLKGMIHHPVIGKLLSAVYCLIFKGVPAAIDLANMMEDKFLHSKLSELNNLIIPRKQVIYALKILHQDIKRLNYCYLKNLSTTAAYLMSYIDSVILISKKKFDQSIRSPLPILSKPSSRSSNFDPITMKSGNFLAMKQMLFSSDKKINIQTCRKPETPKFDPSLEEPAGLEALQNIAELSKANEKKFQVQTDEIEIGEDFLDEKLKKAREQRLEEEQRINRLLNLNIEDIDFNSDLNVKLSEKEVLQYLSACDIKQESTNVLVHLVEKLKVRRARRYNI